MDDSFGAAESRAIIRSRRERDPIAMRARFAGSAA
jgi:hypothetical protein